LLFIDSNQFSFTAETHFNGCRLSFYLMCII